VGEPTTVMRAGTLSGTVWYRAFTPTASGLVTGTSTNAPFSTLIGGPILVIH